MRHVSKDVPCPASLSAQAAVIGRLPSSKLQWQSVSGLPQWMSISAWVSGSSYMTELHSQENLKGKIIWNNSTQSNLRFNVIVNRQCWVSCELHGDPVMRGSVTESWVLYCRSSPSKRSLHQFSTFSCEPKLHIIEDEMKLFNITTIWKRSHQSL